jgi:hypothetical protein
MKAVQAAIASVLGIGAYLYFKNKNTEIDSIKQITTAQSASSAYLPESSATNASNVVIPITAVVLPTAATVVQSSVIQEEDINSLDCATLFLKYNSINNELINLISRLGSNQSHISLLKNRKVLIEQVMKNKNCVVKDPVLESAIIEQKIIAPTRYTNAEISEMVDVYFNDLRNALQGSISSDQSSMRDYNDGQLDRINASNQVLSSIYINSVALKDLLKTFSTKEDVNKYLPLFPKVGFPSSIFSAYQIKTLKESLSTSDLAFLRGKGFKI